MNVVRPTVRERSVIRVAATDAELAGEVAAYVASAATTAIAARGRFTIALAGGNTPKAIYATLAAPPYAVSVDWRRVLFFFGDERCVAPDDPDSNYGMAETTLLRPLHIDPHQIFRMHGEDEPARAAADYAETLVRELGDPPVFDLIMLGMGPDGHTASIFPGSSPVTDDVLIVNAPFVPKVGSYRLTLTPRAINAAREVIVVTAGEAKAEALSAVLDGPYDPNTYPVQIVNPCSGTLCWFVDRAALQLVQNPV
ncbi:MAG: 6-phosphogluconolactonase [Candidatus Eremiobacteraeota bacterium]|nr:6-phosphogluconolactonase [Candidatus Eremiobacteraeota bacterium]